MTKSQTAQAEEGALLRIGGACAILGAVVSVAAGAAVGNVTSAYGTEAVLNTVAARPAWYWPTGHLGFIAGALLWVGAFIAFIQYAAPGASRALGRLASASAVVGASIHALDSSLSGYGLNSIARARVGAPAGERADLVEAGRLLLSILDGTWAGVLTFFHGVPFVLIGMAVMLDSRLPAWFGSIAILAGLGSIAAGVAGFLDASAFPESLFIFFAVIVSLWMVALGAMMWRRAGSDGRLTA